MAVSDPTRDQNIRATVSAEIVALGITKHFGDVEVLSHVDLRVAPGRVVALLGPSGCGKTTLLRVIAGLEHPGAGSVQLGDRTVTGPGAFLPPERRRIGMVFQDWALFPHLTVARNVGYGLAGIDRSEHVRRVEEALGLVGLEGMGHRLPATLSGGQQQRVALARALAPRPSAILLDEPFSNLDTALRVQVRSEVQRLLADLDITTIFVTHDQDEAFVLGDEVAVMHAGRIVQQATPAQLYARPATPWVASFVGEANLLDGVAAGSEASTALGRVPLAAPCDGAARVLLRPEEIRVGPTGNGPSGEGGTEATVDVLEYYGHDTVYVLRLEGGITVRARAGSVPSFRRGDHVSVQYHGPPAVSWSESS